MNLFPSHKRQKPDYIILFSLFSLVLLGLVMLASASSHLGKVTYDDTYYYLKHQVIYGLSLGLIGYFIASHVHYKKYRKVAVPLLLVSIVLLVLIFTPLGVSAKGSARWIRFGSITFQPSELLKLTFIIYLAAWMSKRAFRQKNFWKGFVPFVTVLGIVALLLLKQPSTSTVAILVLTSLIMYFVSGARLRYIALTLVGGALILGMVIYVTPYRLARVQNFFEQGVDIQAGGYHLEQARIAIGSGGLTGVGYGESTTKIRYLPEPVGDSIFAVIAEELGFIGAGLIVGMFLLLTLRTLLLARNTPDRFGQLLLVGFGSLIAIQAFVNIGAISGVLPLTGTPLPFMSYGGTALAVFMTIGGIIVNISKYS